MFLFFPITVLRGSPYFNTYPCVEHGEPIYRHPFPSRPVPLNAGSLGSPDSVANHPDLSLSPPRGCERGRAESATWQLRMPEMAGEVV